MLKASVMISDTKVFQISRNSMVNAKNVTSLISSPYMVDWSTEQPQVIASKLMTGITPSEIGTYQII